MKKTLLFTKKSKLALTLLVFCLCLNYGFSQTNLVQNGTADDHGTSSDNADAWDMTPNGELDGSVTSPYKYDEDDNPNGWYNNTLEKWLEANLTDGAIDPDDDDGGTFGVDEQPGSSSDGTYDGATKTRSVKLYDDADDEPLVYESTRRLYQKVVGLTIGTVYTFNIESRSEAEGTPSQVFILNEAITTEVGLENGASDSRVIAYLEITGDKASKPSEGSPTFKESTFNFTATTTEVVIYVRCPAAVDKDHEVYFDNIELYDASTASIENNEFSRSFNVYPNPASGTLFIRSNEYEVSNVAIFNVMGQKVLEKDSVNKNQLDISGITKGIYILKVSSDSKSFSKKIIIE